MEKIVGGDKGVAVSRTDVLVYAWGRRRRRRGRMRRGEEGGEDRKEEGGKKRLCYNEGRARESWTP